MSLANLSIIVGFIAELNYKNDNTNFVITFHNDQKGSIQRFIAVILKPKPLIDPLMNYPDSR